MNLKHLSWETQSRAATRVGGASARTGSRGDAYLPALVRDGGGGAALAARPRSRGGARPGVGLRGGGGAAGDPGRLRGGAACALDPGCAPAPRPVRPSAPAPACRSPLSSSQLRPRPAPRAPPSPRLGPEDAQEAAAAGPAVRVLGSPRPAGSPRRPAGHERRPHRLPSLLGQLHGRLHRASQAHHRVSAAVPGLAWRLPPLPTSAPEGRSFGPTPGEVGAPVPGPWSIALERFPAVSV